MEDIVTIITSVGFPIAACLCMGWYVKYISDKYSKNISEFQDAINNNTIALTKLCEKIDN